MIVRHVHYALALLLCASAPSFGAEQALPNPAPASHAPANRFAATELANERFEVGATLVERHGEKGTPLILIPGLASGAWAWQETIRALGKEHTIYVLTLPGFDGRPGVAGKGMAAAQDSVRELIETRKLKRPVLIGHSLGGTLSLALAAAHPALVRGVISIDGLPVFPGTEDWPGAQRAQTVARLGNPDLAATGATFAAQQQQYMRGTGTLDMARADELAKLSGKSDPAAVTRYMADGIGTDMRSALGAIEAPVLLISPYAAVDGTQLGMSEDDKTAYYTALMQGTTKLKVQSVSPSRHFAMFDQPQLVNAAIRDFLKTLPQ